MTAPDRGATYQIALASTGSSTHDIRYQPAGAVVNPKRPLVPANRLSADAPHRTSDAAEGQPRGSTGGPRCATRCRTGSRCGQILASRLYTSG